jgi:hypothetical protein
LVFFNYEKNQLLPNKPVGLQIKEQPPKPSDFNNSKQKNYNFFFFFTNENNFCEKKKNANNIMKGFGCEEVKRSIQSSRHIKIRTDTLELAGVVP